MSPGDTQSVDGMEEEMVCDGSGVICNMKWRTTCLLNLSAYLAFKKIKNERKRESHPFFTIGV